MIHKKIILFYKKLSHKLAILLRFLGNLPWRTMQNVPFFQFEQPKEMAQSSFIKDLRLYSLTLYNLARVATAYNFDGWSVKWGLQNQGFRRHQHCFACKSNISIDHILQQIKINIKLPSDGWDIRRFDQILTEHRHYPAIIAKK